MRKSLLFIGAAIVLLGMMQNFDGQQMMQSHRQLPGRSSTVIARQSKMAQAPFFSKQGPNRWTTDQNSPFQHQMTYPIGHRDDRAHVIVTGKTLAQHELSTGVDTAWVRNYSSYIYGGDDAAAAMAIDDFGNVYVTGLSENMDGNYDFATIKYNTSGELLWETFYHCPDNYDGDHGCVNALAIDHDGNVFITGFVAVEVGTHWDCDRITIKYNINGVEQWVAQFDGVDDAGISYVNDRTTDIAVDDIGNVYITGFINRLELPDDYVTIKYDFFGLEQWVARYNGPGNSSDRVNAIAVDDTGNVYVTGVSMGSGTHTDYATIKYSSDGIEQWIARYNDTENGRDEAVDLAVDASENVYVTGSSIGPGRTDFDYTTIKYNADGGEQWITRFNGPRNSSDRTAALVIDDTGNVYVTGTASTVKYNADGIEQWVADKDSGYVPIAIALDKSNNIYVTGAVYDFSPLFYYTAIYTTIKYDVNGIKQWIARYDGDGPKYAFYLNHSITQAVDNFGNVYVVNTARGVNFESQHCCMDYAIEKYNAAGEKQWLAVYNRPKRDHNHATALAVDGFGNIYVSGYSIGNCNSDFVTIKYDASGTMLWVDRCLEGSVGTRLAVDGSGNAYVTGFGANGGYLTVKYNASGEKQWMAHCDRNVVGGYSSPGFPWIFSLAVDASGNVYVTGSVEISNDDTDYITVKYDSSGNEQWLVTYDGPRHTFDEANALAVDDSGNVYITGNSQGNGADIATIKYNRLGIEQWVARFDGPGTGAANNWDMASDIALDENGNIYVTGRTRSVTTSEDFVTIKFDAAGAMQWIARYNGPQNGWDEATALALDKVGNVFVTGMSNDYGDYTTIKYDNSGAQQWVAQYSNGSGRSYDFPYDLAVDGSGNVYVTGFSIGLRDDADFTTIKYNASGVEQWIAQYNGIGNSYDEAWSIAIDAVGQVYVAGTSSGNNWSLMTLIKYGQTSTSVEFPTPKSLIRDFSLSQNYPNPFNPSTTIEFTLPQPAFATLKVYNLLGEEVAKLVAEQRSAGIHKINWDARGLASGVYLYRLEAGDFVQAKKLILMR
jgi:uncharacterized delta-60 repeat protein